MAQYIGDWEYSGSGRRGSSAVKISELMKLSSLGYPNGAPDVASLRGEKSAETWKGSDNDQDAVSTVVLTG